MIDEPAPPPVSLVDRLRPPQPREAPVLRAAPARTNPGARAMEAISDVLYPPSFVGSTAGERAIAERSAQASIERQAREAGTSVPALRESAVGPQAPLERVAKVLS